MVNGQDTSLSKIEVDAADIAGDYASADVTVMNFDTPIKLSYDLIKEDGSWKVDDISSAEGKFLWRLTEIFAATAED